MLNHRSSYADPGGGLRWARRPLLILLVVAAVLGTLSVAERDSGSSASGDPIATRNRAIRSLSGFSGFSDLFGSGSPAGRATAVPLPTIPSTGTTETNGGGGAGNQAAALGIAEQTTTRAVEQAQGAAVLAQQVAPGFIQGIVCPILLQARATVVNTINALEGQFPFLAPQLNAIEASALGVIDALLAQFGCVEISGA